MKLSGIIGIFRRDKGEKKTPGAAAEAVPEVIGMSARATECREPMAVSVFNRCVTLLSETVASLPVEHQKRRHGVYERQESRLQWLLGREPEPGVSAFDYWRQVVRHRIFAGNAFILPIYGPTGELLALPLLSAGSVFYDYGNASWRVDDHYRNIHGWYTDSEIIHIKGDCPHPDGRTGVGVVDYMRLTLDTTVAGDEETRERFANGGNVRGFLTNPPQTVQGFNKYSDRELKKAAAAKDAFFKSGGRITYIPGNAQFKELMLSSADMQFLESRRYTGEQICQFLNVPPVYAFCSGGAGNYKSAETERSAFLMTINPLLRQIEAELDRKLFRSTRERVRFDRSQIFLCDVESRVKWLSDTVAAGLYTINEARAVENRAPVAGGDEPLASANLKTIRSLMAEAPASGGPDNDNNDNGKGNREEAGEA